jgi:hypothetical protein
MNHKVNTKYPTLLALIILSLFSVLHGQNVDGNKMNGDAAYDIWINKMDSDYSAAFDALVAAAKLDHVDACLALARSKWPKEFDYSFFGQSKVLAKIKLLEHAPKSDSRTWWEIGNLYTVLADQDKANQAHARNCYKIAAYGMLVDSWMYYANSCYEADFDVNEAYLFYCAATFVYHPDSFYGELAWSRRKEISRKLGAEKSLKILDELKLLFEKKGHPGFAFASPALDAEDEKLIHEFIDRINKLQADDRRVLMESARKSTP